MNRTYRWFDTIQVQAEEIFQGMIERFETSMMADRNTQLVAPQMQEDMEADDGSYTPEGTEEIINPPGRQLV